MDIGDLAELPGLQAVAAQLEQWIAVLRAEQARRQAGAMVTRQTWTNLVFTGGPGSGKSRAARAVAHIYRDLGLLAYGHLDEAAAATLVGATSEETGKLLRAAVTHAAGGVLMLTGVHAWRDLPDRGEQMLSRLYRELTDSRNHRRDELAVILAGRKGPVGDLLRASPPLAARFPVVVDFPGYTPGQLAAIFGTLAAEAGFSFSPAAAHKAAAVLARAEGGGGAGNARLAVQLLDRATVNQARRITATSELAVLTTITAADIPADLDPPDLSADVWPGQYL